jgi:hypothetical protein
MYGRILWGIGQHKICHGVNCLARQPRCLLSCIFLERMGLERDGRGEGDGSKTLGIVEAKLTWEW